MLIYLDNCCFNRPFDNQKDIKISIETEAKLHIQKEIRNGNINIVWSYILEYENSLNPHIERKISILLWKKYAKDFVIANNTILNRCDELLGLGIKTQDALHLSCAIESGCEYFVTTDRFLVQKDDRINEIKIINPVQFVLDIIRR